MSLTIKICMNTIILSNKAFSTLKETYLSFRDYPNLRHRCPFVVVFVTKLVMKPRQSFNFKMVDAIVQRVPMLMKIHLQHLLCKKRNLS